MKSNRRVSETWITIASAIILTPLAVAIFALLTIFTRDVIHSATLPDEDQAQCESLGGRWSVNHQCYNAGEPMTIKKLKESLRSTAR
jgi:hypothetical protein